MENIVADRRLLFSCRTICPLCASGHPTDTVLCPRRPPDARCRRAVGGPWVRKETPVAIASKAKIDVSLRQFPEPIGNICW